MLRGLVARAEAGDLAVLGVLARAGEQLDAAVNQAAGALRDQHGYSCGDLGRELGMSRQAVLKRLSRDHDSPPAGAGGSTLGTT
jgi:hypothetical protein